MSEKPSKVAKEPESSERILRLWTLDGAIWMLHAPWPNVPGTPTVPASVGVINFIEGGDGEPAHFEVIALPEKDSDLEKENKVIRATIPWDIVVRCEASWDRAELEAELEGVDPPPAGATH